MSAETAQPAATAPPPDSRIIPGVLIVGADRIDRAAVARRIVLSLFAQDQEAALVYVGGAWAARLLGESLPVNRLGGYTATMADVTARGGAVVYGFDAQEEESRYGALCRIRAAFYLIHSRRKTYPFILALDGFTQTIEKPRKARFIEALRAAITAPAVIPVLCFESFAEMEECIGDFGGDGLGLLMQLSNNYILRSDFDTDSFEIVWRFDIPRASAAELPRGKVLVIRQGHDQESGCAVFSEETLDLESLEPPADLFSQARPGHKM